MYKMRGGSKRTEIEEEDGIRDFAFATVVAKQNIKKGERFTFFNTWPKRPGIGEIKARDHEKIIGKFAKSNIQEGEHISNKDF